MKPLKHYLLLLIIGFAIHAAGQSDKDDVIYLNDGTVVYGLVQSRNAGYLRVRTVKDSIIDIPEKHIDKIQEGTTSHIQQVDSNTTYDPVLNRFYKNGNVYKAERTIKEFKYPAKGYFFEAQIPMEYFKFGFRILNGYRFNPYAALALGMGIEISAGHNDIGGFAPMYLYYEGDILKKRITPFYSLELGYSIRLKPNYEVGGISYYEETHSEGGLTGGGGFGVRFYSRRSRFHCSISVQADFIHTHRVDQGYEYGSGDYYHSDSGYALNFGFRYAMGLIR